MHPRQPSPPPHVHAVGDGVHAVGGGEHYVGDGVHAAGGGAHAVGGGEHAVGDGAYLLPGQGSAFDHVPPWTSILWYRVWVGLVEMPALHAIL